jgi:hypothetical protein
MLTRNKQIAMSCLLCTRSAYRAMLEGVPLKGSGAQPKPPLTPSEMLQRFKDVPLPDGFTQSDINDLTDPLGPLVKLFDNVSAPPAQKGNITTNPETIAFALGIDYDPLDPDCPNFLEGNQTSKSIGANLAITKPVSNRPK